MENIEKINENSYEIMTKEKGRGVVSKSLIVTYPDGKKFHFTRYKSNAVSQKYDTHSIFRCTKYGTKRCGAKVIQKHGDGEDEFLHFAQHTCQCDEESVRKRKRLKREKKNQENLNGKKRKRENETSDSEGSPTKKQKIEDVRERPIFVQNSRTKEVKEVFPVPIASQGYIRESHQKVKKKEPYNGVKVIHTFPSKGSIHGSEYVEVFFNLDERMDAIDLLKNKDNFTFNVMFGKTPAKMILVKPISAYSNTLFKNTQLYCWKTATENSQFVALVQSPAHKVGYVDVSITTQENTGVLIHGFQFLDNRPFMHSSDVHACKSEHGLHTHDNHSHGKLPLSKTIGDKAKKDKTLFQKEYLELFGSDGAHQGSYDHYLDYGLNTDSFT